MDFSTNTNFLQPSGFRVIVDRKRFPNIDFYAQSVNMPSLVVNEAPAPYRQYSRVPSPGDSFTYGQLTINAIMDENMSTYIELHNWLKSTVEENFKDQADGYDEPTETDIIVSILNSSNNIVRKVSFRNAFITAMPDYVLEANVDATTPFTFPAEFQYTYFDIE